VGTIKSKSNSLKWAIGELSKQKDELNKKLNIAEKREETDSLINEVLAQKKALEKRISSLEDGLKVSSNLVDEPIDLLEEELSKVNDKLEIAQDRFNTLEQEEYLEELGRKLNGDYADDSSLESAAPEELNEDEHTLSLTTQDVQPSIPTINIESSDSATQKSLSPTPVLMKSPTNRIQSEDEVEESPARIPSTPIAASGTNFEQCAPLTVQNLEACAETLGMEPDYLLNKGMQAVLRMIARNGNKVSFPLEVEQVDKG
jgi:hypothetical protein